MLTAQLGQSVLDAAREGGSSELRDAAKKLAGQVFEAKVSARSFHDKVEIFQTVLLHYFAGRDVRFRCSTRENRSILAGYWIWDMIEMRHTKMARTQVFDKTQGRDEKTFRKTVRRRNWRWKDIVKMYTAITGQGVRETD